MRPWRSSWRRPWTRSVSRLSLLSLVSLDRLFSLKCAHLGPQVNQLQHELGKKDELLRMVASVTEESETDSSATTPQLQHQHPSLGGAPGAAAAAATALSQLEAMRNKLQDLEEENLVLRSEVRGSATEVTQQNVS